MKKIFAPSILLMLCLGMAMQAFGQADASLGGTVVDSTKSVIPGATVTATNDSTGVMSTTTTNQAGVYSFASLLPGTYTVSAKQVGFQTQTFTKVLLGSGSQVRLNFQLEVSGVATQIEITSSAEQLLLETSSSVGDVLGRQTVQELPLVNRNVLDLVKVMSGVIMTDNTIFNANESSFAGVGANAVNIQRDGVMVNDVRWPAGINAATRVNPDLVGEFRMILAPVDAEIGRGNAQIQVLTRSGANEYHGGLVWNVQNTALDPNTWENNRNNAAPPWRNLHQYTASIGGPIIKNKTFFFVLFDGQLNKIRTPYNVRALTPCAKRGIFRYYDNWNNGNARQLLDVGTTPRVAVVDPNGNPTPPPYLDPRNPASGPHNGIIRYASVFGRLLNTPTRPDCSDAIVDSTPWDPYRRQMDTSGFLEQFLKMMPAANNYDIGDGFNTAGHRWSRTLLGADNLFGVGEDTYRRQINLRIDHNFNMNHRINGSWSWEKSWADDNFRTWPNGYGGKSERRPQVLTVNFISTLRPTLLNEVRFGMSRTGSNIFSPYTNPDTGEKLRELLPKMANGVPVVVGPGMGAFGFTPGSGDGASNFYGGRGILSYSGADTSPRYTVGDTVSWTKGAHSLRFGGEFRRSSSEARNQWTGPFWAGYNSYPYVEGGEAGFATPDFTGIIPGLAGTASTGNVRAMRDMLVFFSGSVGQIRQWRYINNVNDTTWNDPIKDPAIVRDVIQKEFSLFFKDDWKVSQDLTLNLGVRYDYYGVPYLRNGLTTGLRGGGGSIFGLTGSFDNWFKAKEGDRPPGQLTELEWVGPDSPNTDKQLYKTDINNISPAIGFAYQLPFLGKGRTTIRGGYQISYIGNAGNFSGIQTNAGQAPGTTYSNNYQPTGQYLDLNVIKTLNEIPVPSGIVPGLAAFPLYEGAQDITVFAPNYVAPYIQNITFAVTRNIGSSLTVDARYVGTLTRKNFSTLNINFPNFLTNGLLEAFNEARAGGNPPLLDRLFRGQRLAPWLPAVDGVTYRGGQALRAAAFPVFALPWGAPGWFTNLNALLANGQYYQLANALNVFGTPRGKYLEDNGFPINFFKANPQFNNATLSANDGHSNYHSFQAQVTLRPTAGISFQTTYTWSKNLGRSGITDPRDLNGDYVLLPSHRAHSWVTYGSWELPFGPRKLLGGNTSGLLARFIEGWQLAWITNVQSGAPLSITAQDMLYGNGVPDKVGDFHFESIGPYWPHGAAAGNYFAGKYIATPGDPQCANVDASIRSLCTLQVIRNAETNEIVFQNPLPGRRGNFGRNNLTNLTRWNVDVAMSKSIQIDETKSFRFRVDATNVFNKAFPSGALGGTGTRIVFPTAPNTNINSGTFGAMPFKVGGRTFQLMMRFDF